MMCVCMHLHTMCVCVVQSCYVLNEVAKTHEAVLLCMMLTMKLSKKSTGQLSTAKVVYCRHLWGQKYKVSYLWVKAIKKMKSYICCEFLVLIHF